MAFLSFLIGNERGTTFASIDKDGVEIRESKVDITTGESHIMTNQVTEHPVESGADISDHIRRKPLQLSLNGVYSDTSISTLDKLQRTQKGEPNTISALKFFEELFEKKYLVTINNRFKSYTNMAVSGITFIRGSNTGTTVGMQVNFKEISTVESQVLQGQAAKEITQGISSSTQNQGKVSTKAPTDATSEASGSFLSRITGLGA